MVQVEKKEKRGGGNEKVDQSILSVSRFHLRAVLVPVSVTVVDGVKLSSAVSFERRLLKGIRVQHADQSERILDIAVDAPLSSPVESYISYAFIFRNAYARLPPTRHISLRTIK